MPVSGLQKFSLIDYPGKLCCIVFFGHCNFRCPYCHNPALVFDPESQGSMSPVELARFLESRKGKLDGVVFSGGEPTLDPDLPICMKAAKELGFSVKLDTNGTSPDVIRLLHGQHTLDSLGIDFKAPFSDYPRITFIQNPHLAEKVKESMRYALSQGIELEIRTTVHKKILSPEMLKTMYAELRELGIEKWVLQQFHKAELIDEELNSEETYSDSELTALARSLGPAVSVRGCRHAR